jgi:hypothetical protein
VLRFQQGRHANTVANPSRLSSEKHPMEDTAFPKCAATLPQTRAPADHLVLVVGQVCTVAPP